jgi:RNA polymerase sigma-70 factor (ECF subfamily)
MPSPATPDLDLLLEHAGWVRALALRLASDSSSADDLVQSTWIAALERPPEPGTPLRRWLAAVVRNFARQERRVAERRTSRELLAARADTSAPASDVVENIALQRTLLAAVSALDEPYRSVIFQRYYEALPPRAIAQRTGVPVKTTREEPHARALSRRRRSRAHSAARDAR